MPVNRELYVQLTDFTSPNYGAITQGNSGSSRVVQGPLKNYGIGVLKFLYYWSVFSYLDLAIESILFASEKDNQYETTYGEVLAGLTTNQLTLYGAVSSSSIGTITILASSLALPLVNGVLHTFTYTQKIVNAPIKKTGEVMDALRNNLLNPSLRPSILKNILKGGLAFVLKEWPRRVLYVLYPSYRYFALIVLLARDIFLFDKNEDKCGTKMQWQYMEQLGKYDCTMCGDWKFVNLRDIYTTQGCINGLLHSNENISDYLDKFEDLVNQGGIASFDLSYQNASTWSEDSFENFLHASLGLDSLQVFNLSSRSNNVWPPDKKLIFLRDFAQRIYIDNLILSNNKIASKIITDFGIGWNSSVFPAAFDVSGNNLDDPYLESLGNMLPYINLHILNGSYNQFTGNGVLKLAPNIPHSQITSLSLRGLLTIYQESFDALINTTAQSKISSFDISDTDMSNIRMNFFGEKLTTSLIKKLVTENNSLTRFHGYAIAPYIRDSQLTEWSLAGNELGDEGAGQIINGAVNSTLKYINLSNNRITSPFVAKNISLAATSLEYLDLSNNPLVKSQIKILIQNLPASLTGIDLSDIPVGDEELELLVNFMQRYKRLQKLILNNTFITEKGINVLTKLINSGYPLYIFSARNTAISSQGVKGIASWLDNSSYLVSLDLTGVAADADAWKTFASSLQTTKSKLEKLYVDYNAFLQGEGASLFKAMINPIDNMEQLSAPTLSRDMRRELAEATPSVPLTQVSIANSQLSIEDLRVICRIVPLTGITECNIEGNEHYQEVDFNTCSISSGSTLKPWLNLDVFRNAYHYLKTSFNSWSFFPTENIRQESAHVAIHHLPEPANSKPFHSGVISSGEQYEGIEFNFNGALLLCLYFSDWLAVLVSKLPSHQPHTLNHTERNKLLDMEYSLQKIKLRLFAQSKSTLGQSGLVSDEINYSQILVSSLETTVQKALKDNQISSVQLQDLQNKFARIECMMHRHAKQNKQLKKEVIIERRKEKRNQKTGLNFLFPLPGSDIQAKNESFAPYNISDNSSCLSAAIGFWKTPYQLGIREDTSSLHTFCQQRKLA